MSMVAKTKIMTYNEYLKIVENNPEHRYEYINGTVYMMGTPSPFHEEISRKLIVKLDTYFKGKGCKPFSGNFGITLHDENSNKHDVIPDLVVVCDTENLSNTEYTGIPSLIIEIVSPSSIRRDYIEKAQIYMKSGIKEYIIINPLSKSASYNLFESNDVSCIQGYSMIEVINSRIFDGLQIDLRELFQNL